MKFFREWPSRHQHPVNLCLHLAGIPLTFLGVYWWIKGMGWPGTAAFFGGYLLQWAGHRIEGNDVGEFIPIKKALGWPTVAVAPQYQRRTPADAAPPAR
jgi:hypothetical protein